MDQYRGRADHPMVCVIKESIEKREAPNKGFAFFQAVEKGEKSYFPKLIARFPWARAQASSAASRLAGSRSSRFTTGVERTLLQILRSFVDFFIVESCHILFINRGLQTSSTLLKALNGNSGLFLWNTKTQPPGRKLRFLV